MLQKAALSRKARFFEQHWPWFVLALVLSMTLAGVSALIVSGAIQLDPSAGGNNLRGYTAPGIALGVLAVVLSLVTLLFSLRKRAMQESWPLFRSTMMAWLWVHVYAGLLAMLAATLHGGFGIFSGSMFSSGKLLFLSFLILVVSGIAWRLAYGFLPERAAPQIANYSQVDAVKRAETQLTEIEKIAAGKSPQFHDAKTRLLATPGAAAMAMQWTAAIPPQEHGDWGEIARLAAGRERALRRIRLQQHYVGLLQGWRKLHVPFSLLVLFLLPIHILGALEVPERTLPPTTAKTGPISPFQRSLACKGCHAAIYEQWASSMHAHAIRSPTTYVQNNLDLKSTLAAAAPPLKKLCVNCHGPAGATMNGLQASLPFSNERLMDGVDCTSCHQYDGAPFGGGGGYQDKYLADLDPGRTYYGPIDDPVGNGFHKSEASNLFKQKPDELCKNCHDVNVDLNGDGKIIKGDDLVLQTTHDEFDRYVKGGGKGTCITCHMPVEGGKRVADGARIPLDQDLPAPDRVVHQHSFAGVDYPLDEVPTLDPEKPLRAALLKSAARLHVEPALVNVTGKPGFAVDVTNIGAGHNLPTGFAFARQLWLEVKATDREGTLLSSGVLAKNTDDLCDSTSMNDALRGDMQGCATADPELVLLQQKLVDLVEPVKSGGKPVLDDVGDPKIEQRTAAKETILQHLTGGVIARIRPLDNKALAPIIAGQTRTFGFHFDRAPAGDVTVTVRMLFRNLPPYFIRAMAREQSKGETPQLAPLVANLQIVEMAQEKVVLKR
jgi:hypothetical protein